MERGKSESSERETARNAGQTPQSHCTTKAQLAYMGQSNRKAGRRKRDICYLLLDGGGGGSNSGDKLIFICLQ
jgi:hypothetical protein